MFAPLLRWVSWALGGGGGNRGPSPQISKVFLGCFKVFFAFLGLWRLWSHCPAPHNIKPQNVPPGSMNPALSMFLEVHFYSYNYVAVLQALLQHVLWSKATALTLKYSHSTYPPYPKALLKYLLHILQSYGEEGWVCVQSYNYGHVVGV